jgi:hypothetical protein
LARGNFDTLRFLPQQGVFPQRSLAFVQHIAVLVNKFDWRLTEYAQNLKKMVAFTQIRF